VEDCIPGTLNKFCIFVRLQRGCLSSAGDVNASGFYRNVSGTAGQSLNLVKLSDTAVNRRDNAE
jgi:hypothetical protein